MNLTLSHLIAGGVAPTQARHILPFLGPALQRFDIVTPDRIAAFLGQCHVESAGFTRLEENLMYTTAARLRAIFPSRFRTLADALPYVRQPERIANRVYAGKIGNGPESSGDGWRFRGRGIKQLTGRANYQQAAEALGRPYLASPGLLREPEDAVLTAAWFWGTHGLNALADAGQIDAITRRVNGPGMLDAATRRQKTAAALSGISQPG